MIGVEKSTIYRVENVAEKPDYKPELQTIADWLRATDGSLTTFFHEIEVLPERVEVRNDSLRSSAADSLFLEADHGRSVSTPDSLALAELRAFVLRLSAALTKAAGTDAQDDRPDSGASAS